MIELFFSFFQIGAFSFGGGFAILPLIQEQVVNTHGWITLSEFTDLVTIAQMTPGPIAINTATFVGTRLYGLPGGIVATLGCVTPSCIIMTLIGYYFFKNRDTVIIKNILTGIRPAIVTLIAVAALTMMESSFFGDRGFSINGLGSIDKVGVIIFIGALIGIRKFKVNVLGVIVGSGGVGLVFYLLQDYIVRIL